MPRRDMIIKPDSMIRIGVDVMIAAMRLIGHD